MESPRPAGSECARYFRRKTTLHITSGRSIMWSPVLPSLPNKASWRAVCAAALFLSGWLATPLSLAVYDSDVCSVSCCITAGHCCCLPHHAFVQGQLEDRNTQVGTPEISRPCPGERALSGASVQTLARNGYRSPFDERDLSNRDETQSQPILLHKTPIQESSSPRGPPRLNRLDQKS